MPEGIARHGFDVPGAITQSLQYGIEALAGQIQKPVGAHGRTAIRGGLQFVGAVTLGSLDASASRVVHDTTHGRTADVERQNEWTFGISGRYVARRYHVATTLYCSR